MEKSLADVLSLHTRKILHYKRLLERAQASAAAQLHALQAEVRQLKEDPNSSSLSASYSSNLNMSVGTSIEDDRYCVCGGKKRGDYWAGYRDDEEGEDDGCGGALVNALRGRGNGIFDEKAVRKAVRTLGRKERMRL